jgi:hypothetical protein
MLIRSGLVMVAFLTTTTVAHGAGYMVSEIGPKAIGRSGAFVVNPDDPTAMWLNPAGLSAVKGAQVYFGSSLVRLKSSFLRSCRPTCEPTPYERLYGTDRAVVGEHPGHAEGGFEGDTSSQPLLGTVALPSNGTANNISFGRVVPFVAVSLNGDLLGAPGLGLGAAIYGPNTGGVQYGPDACDTLTTSAERNICKAAQPMINMAAEKNMWPQSSAEGVQRYSIIEAHPVEVFYEIAASYRLNRYFGLGLGLAFETIGTRQRVAFSVDKDGRETRYRDVDVSLDLNAYYVPTVILGFTSNPVAGLHVGGSFIPPRLARARGPIALDTHPNSDVQSDLGLTFDDSQAQAIGAFATPAVARVGIAYNFAPWWDVELAVVREFWSLERRET